MTSRVDDLRTFSRVGRFGAVRLLDLDRPQWRRDPPARSKE
jgi:hypothetical protein